MLRAAVSVIYLQAYLLNRVAIFLPSPRASLWDASAMGTGAYLVPSAPLYYTASCFCLFLVMNRVSHWVGNIGPVALFCCVAT